MRTEDAMGDIVTVLVALSKYIPEIDCSDGVTRRCQFCEGTQNIYEPPTQGSGHAAGCPVKKAHALLLAISGGSSPDQLPQPS